VVLYANDSRDRVRDAVDFIEVVSAKTELRAAGVNRYVGLCPFHEERTPSFGIDPQQKLYHCFGCGASGDVFTFVSETESVDFKGALELLADRYGVELKPEVSDPRALERMRKRERLLELLERTVGYYERYLWESAEAAKARAYLAERGLSEATLRQFRVGYAPSAWDRVLLASRRGGFSERELHDAGLVARNAKTAQVYDRFRERIMFPLSDLRGKVLGFGARAMRDQQGPKYLNSADNDLYHKGRHLYGSHLARAEAARQGEVIVCEGYTDVIAMHQAGLANSVGLMGTAMTAAQLQEAARLAPKVLLALDADGAGQEAVLRAARVASSQGSERKLDLRVVRLPSGPDGPSDPADLISRDGGETMKLAVASSMPFLRFRVERVLDRGDRASAEGRERMLDELWPVFAEMPDGPMRIELTRLVSDKLELSDGVTARMLAPAVRQQSGTQPVRAKGGGMSRREQAERSFLALCIAFPREGGAALARIDVEQHFTGALLCRAAAHLQAGHLTAPTDGVSADDHELMGMLAELAAHASALAGADTSTVRAEEAAAQIEVQRLQLELARLERLILAARARRDGEVTEVAAQRAAIKREFDVAQQHALEVAGSTTS
jgi:DNA primase